MKQLSVSVKQQWEDKATRMNEENAAKYAEETGNCGSPIPPPENVQNSMELCECRWDKCDFQFEDSIDCMEHCIQEGTGHVPTHFANLGSDVEYNCLRSCVPYMPEPGINKNKEKKLPNETNVNKLPFDVYVL